MSLAPTKTGTVIKSRSLPSGRLALTEGETVEVEEGKFMVWVYDRTGNSLLYSFNEKEEAWQHVMVYDL